MKGIGKSGLIAMCVAVLGGCTHVDSKSVREEIESSRNSLANRPTLNITGFTPALRCMDQLMIDFGVGNISLMVEDMEDKTEAVKVGARDMFISAVSDMTQRSRAIRLVTFGNDTRNIATYLDHQGGDAAFKNLPLYDIRGSITQFDKDVVNKQADIGASTSRSLFDYNYDKRSEGGLGASRSASGSVLGLDLAVITSRDMALVPGVTSSNAVVITRSGKALDGEALINKWGLNFSVSVNKSEGLAQGVRSLVQLASIELIGKLTKTPYWRCLGVKPDHLEIRRQLSDWYYVLNSSGVLTQYVKEILALRGAYRGPINNVADRDFNRVVMVEKRRLGLDDQTPDLNFRFYKALMNAPSSGQYSRAGDGKYELSISTPLNPGEISPGDELVLDVKSNREGYLSCYQHSPSHGSLVHIFPNAQTKGDGFIAVGKDVRLPDNMGYSLKAGGRADADTVLCMITPRQMNERLPEWLRNNKLDGRSLDEIAQTVETLSGGNIGKVTVQLVADGGAH